MIKVYASASIGNIGVGFDVLGVGILPIDGALLGDIISVERSDSFSLYTSGKFFHELPTEVENNIVYHSWKYFCACVGEDFPVSIYLEKNIPISSGLGSSACSIVATLVAMNHYSGNLLSNHQLLMLMGEMEGKISGEVHFDNVSPCFLGGVQIILQTSSIISQRIPIFSDWLWVMAYPGIKISTLEARSMLPIQYHRNDCITHGRYLSGFVHACYTDQESLAINMMKDIISEPYRSQLLPDFFSIREEVISLGALICGISGSGPTLFCVVNDQLIANNVANLLSGRYLQNDEGFVCVCRLNFSGVQILSE
ncbi:homoserine kinase [Blochmannia endosymbiont of Polyrhachis (Hedomyrma) turneri]|uniref:homoserine kinase n=1 Tax=Blochmannia endosymbiont of Polyrhachis (Hedomyrma) turneri TaxID=1505596 RepID=UPI00061A7FD4|nr:homoserine kinase [Blochmannia endosymbiont of Polyrhachis (Hedomyrma) turneri]AKC59696.1 homoserine kinase [Blochmannia endosymbiont of Polyrhachis (Hedomyrma) turneri]